MSLSMKGVHSVPWKGPLPDGVIPSTVYFGEEARKAMGSALRAPSTPAEQVERIVRVLNEFGIQPAEKVEPLPAIDRDGICLVAWMAVRGTKQVQPS